MPKNLPPNPSNKKYHLIDKSCLMFAVKLLGESMFCDFITAGNFPSCGDWGN